MAGFCNDNIDSCYYFFCDYKFPGNKGGDCKSCKIIKNGVKRNDLVYRNYKKQNICLKTI
jgi:hypothetical protein